MLTLLRHQYPAVVHILTHSVNLTFGRNGVAKINVGFGLDYPARLQLCVKRMLCNLLRACRYNFGLN